MVIVVVLGLVWTLGDKREASPQKQESQDGSSGFLVGSRPI